MLDSYSNSISEIYGSQNIIIQIIDQNGEKISADLQKLIKQGLKNSEHFKERELLLKRIGDLESFKELNKKLSIIQEKEILELKNLLFEKNEKIEQDKKLISKLYLSINGIDLTITPTVYASAYSYYIKGDISSAMSALDTHKMSEDYKYLNSVIEDHIKAWLFKAKLHRLNQEYKLAADCYSQVMVIENNFEICLEVGEFYSFIGNFEEAEICFKSGLLKAKGENQKSKAFDNLANLYHEKNNFKKAKKYYLKALKIIAKFGDEGSEDELFRVSIIYNNLGILFTKKEKYEKAEKVFSRSLEIRRSLAKSNPGYSSSLAKTLINLGLLFKRIDRYEESEKFLLEALEIKTQQAKIESKKYQVDIARIFNNLGLLLMRKEDFKKASEYFFESLNIWNKVVEKNPKIYGSGLANILNNLGELNFKKKAFQKAEYFYHQSFEIRIKYSEISPQIYEIPLADTCLNLSNLYRNNIKNKSLSIGYAKKAVSLYCKYSIPHAERWRNVAQENIDYWNEEEN